MVAKRPDFRRLACAFSSGTGICSRARGRTSTRARSHVSGRGQGTRSSSSVRNRIPGASISAAPRSSDRSCPTDCSRSSSSTATRASSRELLQNLTTIQRARYVDANARALESRLPADLVFANHVLPGGAVAAATGARYGVKAHGSELEYSIRGNEELVAEALGGARRGRRRVRRLRAHPRRARRGRRPRRPRPRGAARRRRGRVPPARTGPRRSRPCSTSAAAIRPIPATARSGSRTRATPAGSSASSTAASCRPSSTSGSCSTTRASTCSSRRCTASPPAP